MHIFCIKTCNGENITPNKRAIFRANELSFLIKFLYERFFQRQYSSSATIPYTFVAGNKRRFMVNKNIPREKGEKNNPNVSQCAPQCLEPHFKSLFRISMWQIPYSRNTNHLLVTSTYYLALPI